MLAVSTQGRGVCLPACLCRVGAPASLPRGHHDAPPCDVQGDMKSAVLRKARKMEEDFAHKATGGKQRQQ